MLCDDKPKPHMAFLGFLKWNYMPNTNLQALYIYIYIYICWLNYLFFMRSNSRFSSRDVLRFTEFRAGSACLTEP